MRLGDVRKFALSLPETTEQPHFKAASFRVRGKIFATVPPGGKQLRVFVEPAEAEALLARRLVHADILSKRRAIAKNPYFIGFS